MTPSLIYGTAWKEDETSRLVRLALDAGFRAIDTANQRRHYHEAGVGEALAQAFAAGLKREDLFLQTKFTNIDGQDQRLPYEAGAPVASQVEQSIESSLKHLGVDRLDSYVLHGPTMRRGLGAEDWEAWRAMEAAQKAGKTRALGVSNVSLEQLEEFHAKAAVKPSIVQNRCFAVNGWDRAIRSYCRAHGIAYQGFSLLNANPQALRDPYVHELAKRLGRTIPQVIYRFAHEIGMVVLTGATNPEHMAQALRILDFELPPEALEAIESLSLR